MDTIGNTLDLELNRIITIEKTGQQMRDEFYMTAQLKYNDGVIILNDLNPNIRHLYQYTTNESHILVQIFTEYSDLDKSEYIATVNLNINRIDTLYNEDIISINTFIAEEESIYSLIDDFRMALVYIHHTMPHNEHIHLKKKKRGRRKLANNEVEQEVACSLSNQDGKPIESWIVKEHTRHYKNGKTTTIPSYPKKFLEKQV